MFISRACPISCLLRSSTCLHTTQPISYKPELHRYDKPETRLWQPLAIDHHSSAARSNFPDRTNFSWSPSRLGFDEASFVILYLLSFRSFVRQTKTWPLISSCPVWLAIAGTIPVTRSKRYWKCINVVSLFWSLSCRRCRSKANHHPCLEQLNFKFPDDCCLSSSIFNIHLGVLHNQDECVPAEFEMWCSRSSLSWNKLPKRICTVPDYST